MTMLIISLSQSGPPTLSFPLKGEMQSVCHLTVISSITSSSTVRHLIQSPICWKHSQPPPFPLPQTPPFLPPSSQTPAPSRGFVSGQSPVRSRIRLPLSPVPDHSWPQTAHQRGGLGCCPVRRAVSFLYRSLVGCWTCGCLSGLDGPEPSKGPVSHSASVLLLM